MKTTLKRFIFVWSGLIFWTYGFSASEINWEMEAFEPDLSNVPSLQNGFKVYVNYCLGCHSLQYQRYERTADDLMIPHDLLEANLIFTDQKKGALITTAMDPVKAKAWFGAPPPDLTMVARARDEEWVYNYLKTFYVDDSRPFGVNNKVFENVGMPHVLLDLQGSQRKVCKQVPKLVADDGEIRDPWYLAHRQFITEEKCGQDLMDRGYSPLELVEGSGELSAEEYTQVVYDLTNFLYYVGDPALQGRERTGILVLLFLAVFFVFTYLLGKEYTKEFH